MHQTALQCHTRYMETECFKSRRHLCFEPKSSSRCPAQRTAMPTTKSAVSPASLTAFLHCSHTHEILPFPTLSAFPVLQSLLKPLVFTLNTQLLLVKFLSLLHAVPNHIFLSYQLPPCSLRGEVLCTQIPAVPINASDTSLCRHMTVTHQWQ